MLHYCFCFHDKCWSTFGYFFEHICRVRKEFCQIWQLVVFFCFLLRSNGPMTPKFPTCVIGYTTPNKHIWNSMCCQNSIFMRTIKINLKKWMISNRFFEHESRFNVKFGHPVRRPFRRSFFEAADSAEQISSQAASAGTTVRKTVTFVVGLFT